jgi:hypothetical protein
MHKVNRNISSHLSSFPDFSSLNLYGDWHLNFHSITTTTGKTVHLSITYVGITNEDIAPFSDTPTTKKQAW